MANNLAAQKGTPSCGWSLPRGCSSHKPYECTGGRLQGQCAAKTFDSLSPTAMIAALQRFGLPTKVLNLISAIYTDRRFKVKDFMGFSTERRQNSGISQGCPLSPFLVVMVMTIVLKDAVAELLVADQKLRLMGKLNELLYADDTLILSVSPKPLERFLTAISTVGARYGLKLHWGKLQLLSIRGQNSIQRPDGSTISAENEITYLGAAISSDGRTGRELTRRVGMAKREFLHFHVFGGILLWGACVARKFSTLW